MNPIMSESDILSLIDKAVEFRKSLDDGDSTFITVRLDFGRVWEDFSDFANSPIYAGTIEDIPTMLFDLSLNQYYISNVKPFSRHTLRVNFKKGLHGRDTNFGVDTIDKLISVMKKRKG